MEVDNVIKYAVMDVDKRHNGAAQADITVFRYIYRCTDYKGGCDMNQMCYSHVFCVLFKYNTKYLL